jgi:hypothetical protein
MTTGDLRTAFRKAGLSEQEGMNVLQGESGMISDLCVEIEDVAQADIECAVRWIQTFGIRF